MFYHICSELKAATNESIRDTLNSGTYSPKKSKLFTTKEKLFALQITHFESKLSDKIVIYQC